MLFKILTGWETLIRVFSSTLHSTRSPKSQKCWPSWSNIGVLISSWVPCESSTSYSLCAENGHVFNIKESEGIWKGNRFGFLQSTILFFRSKFSRKSGRSSPVPVITDSWLDPGAYTLVRDRSGKEGRTWVGYSVSVLPGVVPIGPRVSFKTWEQIFRLPILYLTTTQAIPSTCNGKASLHFPTLCWILPNSGIQNMRNADHSQLQALGINNITSAEYIIQCLSKQRIWFHLLHLVYRSTRTITFYTSRREQLASLLPYD